MTTMGWIIMTISLALVWGATFWSFYRVLTTADDHLAEPPAGLGP